MNPKIREAYKAAVRADNRFSALLEKEYGRDAGDARYDSRGHRTPELAAANAAKIKADDHWRNLVDLERKGLLEKS